MVQEGEEGDELFIVLTGKCGCTRGRRRSPSSAAGEHFGEMALVDKAPRSASVSASDESKLLAIRRRDFFDIIRKDHDVAVKLLWSFLGVLTERLRSTSRELGEAREQLSLDLTDELLSPGDITELTESPDPDTSPESDPEETASDLPADFGDIDEDAVTRVDPRLSPKPEE